MITIIINAETSITQNYYDNILANLPFHELTCSCGEAGCMIIHGYYYRSIRQASGKTKIRICRLRCCKCKRTHSILIASIVPYSQIPASDQKKILDEHLKNNKYERILQSNLNINESDVRHIISRYKKVWMSLLNLLPSHIQFINNSLNTLIIMCLMYVGRQFMQMKRINNIMYSGYRGYHVWAFIQKLGKDPSL